MLAEHGDSHEPAPLFLHVYVVESGDALGERPEAGPFGEGDPHLAVARRDGLRMD